MHDAVLAAMTFQLAGRSYRAELWRAGSWRGLATRFELQWVVTGEGRQWVLPGLGKPTDTPEDLRERFIWRLLPQQEPGWGSSRA